MKPWWRTGLGLDARLDRAWNNAAQRVHDRLIADPSSFARPPAATGALALALAVITAFAGAATALVWLAATNDLWWRWPLIAGIFGFAWLLIDPLARRLPKDSIPLPAEQFPDLHSYVAFVATALGVRPPAVIVADLRLNAAVTNLRWGRRALIVGLPAWALWQPDQRTAILAHELGHLRAGDTTRAHILHTSELMLSRAHYLLAPGPIQGPGGGGPFRLIVHLLHATLAAPFTALMWAQGSLRCVASQHQEYLADRAAAGLTGAFTVQTALAALDVGLETELLAAVNRGEDAFTWLRERPAMSVERLAGRRRLLEAESETRAARWSTHPPQRLRLSLLANTPPPAQETPVDWELMARADAELAPVIDTQRRAYAHSLRRQLFR